MIKRTISGMIGTGSLAHNRREFIAENVDPDRVQLNICYQNENLKEVYKELFDEAVERYNIGKRKDRQITNYYEKIRQGKQEKLFHEVIFQIGNREDMAVGTEEGDLAVKVLDEYVKNFQQRNPTLHVFSCYLHQDEATPHLHIDYVPVGHYKRGQDTQNGIAQALKEMGFGEGKGAIARWRASEIEVLNQICLAHGIKPLDPEKSRGSMSVKEYKEARREADQLEVENTQLKSQNKAISFELAKTNAMLEKANRKKIQLLDIRKIEVKPSVFGNKITVDKDDYDKLHALAEKEVVSVKQTRKLSAENKKLSEENVALKSTVDQQVAELTEYRKPATMSAKTLIKHAKEISEKEQLVSDLQKARSFIASNGLSEKFRRYKSNTKNHKLD